MKVEDEDDIDASSPKAAWGAVKQEKEALDNSKQDDIEFNKEGGA